MAAAAAAHAEVERVPGRDASMGLMRRGNRASKRHAHPTLVALVAGLVLFGVLHYSLLLAVGSAIFVGFFGWLWWQRRHAAPAPKRKPARKRKR